jgi:FKBP-type peptidyl-prolyl cis-trans isomerase 2
MVGVINEVKDDTVTIDFNHPMAGKDLNFEIELVSID